MNSTDKYIYGRQEIDPLTFREVGVAEVSLVVTNNEIGTSVLARCQLDKWGQLSSCQRKSCEWTAFPALGHRLSVTDPDRLRQIELTEMFEYKDGRLRSSQRIENETQKVIGTTEYIYDKTLLKAVDTSFCSGGKAMSDHTIFEYDHNSELVQTSRSTGINDSTSIHIKTTFELNGDGLVTEKQVRNETRMGDSLIAYTTEEAFVYNVYHQIEKSTQSTVLDGVAVTVTRQFTYVTPSSNLIAKIETLEESGKSTADGGLLKDEKQSSNTVYVYDQADRISSILTSRNSASASKTTYKRKFKN